jgi:hypothetical protein
VPSPTPNVVKKDIMKKSLQEWKLLESIERAELEIDGLVKRWGGKLNFAWYFTYFFEKSLNII